MSDYTELVEALRCCGNEGCHKCPYQKHIHEKFCWVIAMKDAAAAIEELQADQKKTVTQIFGEEQMAWEGRCKALMYQIADLQAQLPKRSEWELIDGAEPMRWGCSRCKYMSWKTSNYCPRCGAKMEVQDADT